MNFRQTLQSAKHSPLATQTDHGMVLATAILLVALNLVAFAYCALSQVPMFLAVVGTVVCDIAVAKYLTKKGFFYKCPDWTAMGSEDQAGTKTSKGE